MEFCGAKAMIYKIFYENLLFTDENIRRILDILEKRKVQ